MVLILWFRCDIWTSNVFIFLENVWSTNRNRVRIIINNINNDNNNNNQCWRPQSPAVCKDSNIHTLKVVYRVDFRELQKPESDWEPQTLEQTRLCLHSETFLFTRTTVSCFHHNVFFLTRRFFCVCRDVSVGSMSGCFCISMTDSTRFLFPKHIQIYYFIFFFSVFILLWRTEKPQR